LPILINRLYAVSAQSAKVVLVTINLILIGNFLKN